MLVYHYRGSYIVHLNCFVNDFDVFVWNYSNLKWFYVSIETRSRRPDACAPLPRVLSHAHSLLYIWLLLFLINFLLSLNDDINIFIYITILHLNFISIETRSRRPDARAPLPRNLSHTHCRQMSPRDQWRVSRWRHCTSLRQWRHATCGARVETARIFWVDEWDTNGC